MNVMKAEIEVMKNSEKYCALVFDEMSLERGLYYSASKQEISGFQDLGRLGRSNVHANHALVFMVRGIHKSWKQVVAYYFTHTSVSSITLKSLITYVIRQLQEIGLKVVCTVCDQGATNQRALKELCCEKSTESSPFHFVVRDEPIAVIYDVPHILKNTRNALLGNKISLGLKQRPVLNIFTGLFFWISRFKVAATQLSHTVAAVIETYVAFNILPAEAIYTAEFVEKMDCLFDSLNSFCCYPQDGKSYMCVLSAESPHIEMWYSLLQETENWKVLELGTGRDKTNMFSFISGWQTTIRSLMFIWNQLKKGFNFLSMRAFNQDPVENVFCCVRQHGVPNTNPTCFQFKAVLKTVIVNNMSLPTKSLGNCEDDRCMPLSNLRQFLGASDDNFLDSTIDHSIIDQSDLHCALADNEAAAGSGGADVRNDRQALAYVAGYIL
ncbi:LOW QUALITY PROTEIN: uncharacterized protein LOC126226241 [Schistocerca nitens]|uniref:LOW QUALITY PROTEIN: uncharacterized protein LOC126226241 n=1 Tax=Schistocerca nitens TaxID=7011 RepID=UPI002117F837|nr:LOW QUALITY PROTEIN: uncharacterized protein LOC126226241 [Schistocerca nitens]